MLSRNVTELIRPAQSAMDLDAGKPNAKDAFFSGGFTLASLLFAAIGCWLSVWSLPRQYDDSSLWYVATGFGSLLALFALRMGWRWGNMTIEEWADYQYRKQEWHEVTIEAYRALRGQERIISYGEYELNPALAHHVLLAGLAVHRSVMQSGSGRAVPYSVRSLEEKLYIGNNASNTVLVGELKGTAPEKMSNTFAQLGWVRNRKDGKAGDWAPQSVDELINTFTQNWGKVKQ